MAKQSTRRRSPQRRAGRPSSDTTAGTREPSGLCLRAPGREIEAGALLERVATLLAAMGSPAALDPAQCLADGRLSRAQVREGRFRAGASILGSRERIEPGTALRIAGVRAPAGPPTGGVAEILVPQLPWPLGRIDDGVDFECIAAHAGLMRLRVSGDLQVFRRWVAAAGWPAIGDLEMGGVIATSAACWARADVADPLPWPDEAVFVGSGRRGRAGPPRFQVSRATAKALAKGHPWVLADRATDDVGRFASGTCVELMTEDSGTPLGTALVDGDGAVAARWFGGAPGEVDARVSAAVRRRRSLLEAVDSPNGTDAIRLVHGEADGLPGVGADRFGDLLRVQWAGRASLGMRRRVVESLVRSVPGFSPETTPVIEVTHLRAPPPGALCAVEQTRGTPLGEEEIWVREAGLRFRIDPGLREPNRPRPGVGFFLDQRANRARVAARVRRGGRYLNLFAHTGAFSARMLAAGAGEVSSVDLSAPYLAWLAENLRASGLDDGRHHAVQRDVRAWMDALDPDEHFDGIVLDPPTAAAAGRRFWSVAQGIGPLLEQAIARLRPGGFLLACRNDHQGGSIREPILAAARAVGATVEIRKAPASEDFPGLAGFPEGTPFTGMLATIRD